MGFSAASNRAGTLGHGDGNGELDGGGYAWGQTGENLMFWDDLSTNSNLIVGNFTTADNATGMCFTSSACAVFLPYAQIGRGNFVYVYSGNASSNGACCVGIGANFFGLNVINHINGGSNVSAGGVPPAPGLTVAEAYNIDKKIDDGMPMSGTVMAQYLGGSGSNGQPSWATNAGSASATTCFDTATVAYSITQNNGTGLNCGISFQIK